MTELLLIVFILPSWDLGFFQFCFLSLFLIFFFNSERNLVATLCILSKGTPVRAERGYGQWLSTQDGPKKGVDVLKQSLPLS